MDKTSFTTNGSRLTVTRAFDANLALVWRAWTEAELLDQWWAPSPWKSKTKKMEFKEGGMRLYAMCGPTGEEHWGKTTYTTINEGHDFAGEDAFCDENGTVNPAFPVAKFQNIFAETSGKTTVTIITEYDSLEHLQQVVEMGMKEGLSITFENLDGLINKWRKT